MLSDDHDSRSHLPIVFRYGAGSIAAMIFGFPILLAMFVIFPIISVQQLMVGHGRLLPNGLPQAGRWDDSARVTPSMAQVDPFLPVATGSFAASESDRSTNRAH